MGFLGLRHEFFNPLWRRIATTAFCGLWAIWEYSNAEMFWASLFFGIAVACFYTFFLSWEHVGKPKE